jgi:NADPH2 dehydrogenase
MSTSRLFEPIRVGNLALQNRVVLAPLTRIRASNKHVPLPNVKLYYAQRASSPGTLLITEATFIAQRAGGLPNPPGIWSDEQIKAWKEVRLSSAAGDTGEYLTQISLCWLQVTDAVHEAGSFIYCQLWALGRTANEKCLRSENPDFPYVSASDVKLDNHEESPRPLTTEEIKEYVDLHVTAAKNAVEKAGFDGVEIHGANGYLIDQFLQDVTNKRTDEYGGNVENRSRFGLEVVEAVVKAIGAEKTGIRLSPWSTFQRKETI